jgi:hypothetical protein
MIGYCKGSLKEGDDMIQKWIKDELKTILPNLEWTIDFKTGQDHTGTVYMESPGTPSNDDLIMLFPTYSVELESSDRKNIDDWALKVYDLMNRRHRETIRIGAVDFDLVWINAIPPIPVGFDGQKQIYTINLQTTIRKITNTITV